MVPSPSALSIRVAQTGKNHLNEKITLPHPPALGEASDLAKPYHFEHAALLRRCKLPLYTKVLNQLRGPSSQFFTLRVRSTKVSAPVCRKWEVYNIYSKTLNGILQSLTRLLFINTGLDTSWRFKRMCSFSKNKFCYLERLLLVVILLLENDSAMCLFLWNTNKNFLWRPLTKSFLQITNYLKYSLKRL